MIPSVAQSRIPAMTSEAINRVRELEEIALGMPQIDIATHHIIHGGMYARTITIPAGVVLTGAEIKLATVLVLFGHVRVTMGDEVRELAGYHVLAASKDRKQAFLALTDTHLTMIFPSCAQTVEEAEREFTDEHDKLFSRNGENHVCITGE